MQEEFMNPAAVAVKIKGSKILVKAYAKEGLIKQHTAEKAVKQVFDVLV